MSLPMVSKWGIHRWGSVAQCANILTIANARDSMILGSYKFEWPYYSLRLSVTSSPAFVKVSATP